MKLPNWKDDTSIRHAFSWLTRYGMGRKFGTVPVGWYQAHQCAALEVIEEAARAEGIPIAEGWEVRCKAGVVEVHNGEKSGARWQALMPAKDVFARADVRARC